MMNSLKNRGFSIVELIVSVAIIITVITATIGAWQLYFRVLRASAVETQAALITEEASEALLFLRDSSWDANIASVILDTTYYLSWVAGQPTLSNIRTEFLNGYVAEIALTAINRDYKDNITKIGGTLDPRTLSAFITITPYDNPAKIILQSETLIHDLFQN